MIPLRLLAQKCFARRRLVVAAWLVVLVALTLLHGAAGSHYKDAFRISGTESAEVMSLLQRGSPTLSGDVDRVVVAAKRGRLTDEPVRARVKAMLGRIARLPHVGEVASPYGPAGTNQIAGDGKIAYATITFDEQAIKLPVAQIRRLISVARAAAGGDLEVELGGQAIALANQRSSGGTGPGFLAAAIVLVLVFGSLLAALLPLLTAAVSLGVGTALIGLLSNVVSMPSFSLQLSLLIGLGVGVDYALFIVTRYRQSLLAGQPSEEAALTAVQTSGRAVLIAGMIVCIALLGMLVLGVSFLYGVAVAASIVVAVTVLAALTLLPALLGFLGPRVLGRRDRRILAEGRRGFGSESRWWGRLARRVASRPWVYLGMATALMVVVALPVTSMRLGSSDQGGDPASTTTRRAYDLLAHGFGPGFNGPLSLVATVRTPAQEAAMGHAVAAVRGTKGVALVTGPRLLPGAGRDSSRVISAQVIPTGSPQDAATTDLLHRLRGKVLPAATRRSGIRVLVGGQTAIFEDFSTVLSRKLPLFIGMVVALSFLLLVAVFRSLLVPLMAAAMNLLSVATAFGVVVAVFQWGWLEGLVGIDRTGPIEAFLPVMIFAILFGLSMDYEVFLVNRIHEEWNRRGDNHEAVVHGLAETGRTITAAAAIMVLVFAAFVLGGQRVIKVFGVGLSSAVLLDAFVVRCVLVPGLLLIIGERNWWLPAWLDRRLPSFRVEGPVHRASDPATGSSV